MQSFATIEQYDARFPGRTASNETLQACLDDASAAIANALESRGIAWDEPSEELEDRMMRACRSVASRILPQDESLDLPVGLTQATMGAGSYTRSYSFSGSYGTPKLLPSELDMLGIGGGRVGWARLGGHDDVD